jgi:hypothetical protein
MSKQAISVTLEADNLTWLRGRARATTRSLSETLDRLIVSVRRSGGAAQARSVAGTITIGAEDPRLLSADAAVRSLFARRLGLTVRARTRETPKRGRGRARG